MFDTGLELITYWWPSEHDSAIPQSDPAVLEVSAPCTEPLSRPRWARSRPGFGSAIVGDCRRGRPGEPEDGKEERRPGDRLGGRAPERVGEVLPDGSVRRRGVERRWVGPVEVDRRVVEHQRHRRLQHRRQRPTPYASPRAPAGATFVGVTVMVTSLATAPGGR